MAGSDDLEKWAEEVISGKDRSILAFFTRRVFGLLSHLFKLIAVIRVKLFQAGGKEQVNLSTMVVSVGNLTVGGTGKTPVVEKFSRELAARGRKVAILTRGYKSKALPQPQDWEGVSKDVAYDILPKVVSDHQKNYLQPPYSGDEPYMLAKNLPGVAVLVDKDRVKSARFALQHLGSDTFMLDDGMQYLKLKHKFDIVLLDQNGPFGKPEALLPRGTLREPPRQLKRAQLIIITKCKSQTAPDLLKRIRKYNPKAGIVECRHEAVELENLYTGEKEPLSFMAGKYVAAVSGIAVPKSFETLLEKHGADVLFHKEFTDHHNFTQKESDRIMERAFTRDAHLIVTTEKDAVRYLKPTELDVPIYFLRIEIKILSGQEHWDAAVQTVCASEYPHPVDYGYDQLLKRRGYKKPL